MIRLVEFCENFESTETKKTKRVVDFGNEQRYFNFTCPIFRTITTQKMK